MPLKVLVFDSGVGGFSIVKEIAAQKISIEIDYCADTEFFPYGNRSDLELLARIPKIVSAAAEKSKADVVIVACNTASTIALWQIRQAISIPIIGVVPAIKPAADQSISKSIGLLATPRTVGSAYTNELIENFARNCKVFRYAPESLARAAENYILGDKIDKDAIEDAVRGIFSQKGSEAIDVVVLACTHYPLVLGGLQAAAPQGVKWLDSGSAIARRLTQVLDLQINNGETRMGIAYTSGGNDDNFALTARRFGFEDSLRLEL